jgi:hypothetical protein
MAGPNLGGTTVGQLSQNAYPGYSPPSGWNVAGVYSTGGQSFTVMVNPSSKLVDFSFEGTTTVSQFISDISDGGAAAWSTIAPLATSTYSSYTGNSSYSGYQFICTGHSVGAADCAAFAVQEDISGYGVNGMPISSQTVSNYFGSNWSSDYSKWTTSGNNFQMYNNEGDIATLVFSNYGGGTFLNTGATTTTYASPYAACEAASVDTVVDPVSGPVAVLGALTGIYCAWKDHSVAEEITLSQSSSATGDTAWVNQDIAANWNDLNLDFQAYMTGTNTSFSALDGGISVTNISTTGAGSNYAGYSLTGSYLSFYSEDAVTGAGDPTVATGSAFVDVMQGDSATVSGADDSILCNASSDTTISGSDDTSDAFGSSTTVDQTGNSGTLDVNGNYGAAYLYGGYDSSYLYGNYDAAGLDGFDDSVVFYGYNDFFA